jgi:hypothetical protein
LVYGYGRKTPHIRSTPSESTNARIPIESIALQRSRRSPHIEACASSGLIVFEGAVYDGGGPAAKFTELQPGTATVARGLVFYEIAVLNGHIAIAGADHKPCAVNEIIGISGPYFQVSYRDVCVGSACGQNPEDPLLTVAGKYSLVPTSTFYDEKVVLGDN